MFLYMYIYLYISWTPSSPHYKCLSFVIAWLSRTEIWEFDFCFMSYNLINYVTIWEDCVKIYVTICLFLFVFLTGVSVGSKTRGKFPLLSYSVQLHAWNWNLFLWRETLPLSQRNDTFKLVIAILVDWHFSTFLSTIMPSDCLQKQMLLLAKKTVAACKNKWRSNYKSKGFIGILTWTVRAIYLLK